MLLNSFSANNSPQNNDDIQPITANTDNQRRNISPQNGLSRLFNSSNNCCNNNVIEDDQCPNNGLSFSTILFFILIFLILFYRS